MSISNILNRAFPVQHFLMGKRSRQITKPQRRTCLPNWMYALEDGCSPD